MEYILLAFVVCASNAFCFALGARIGQMINKGERVAPPQLKINSAKKAAKEKRDAYSVILQNIETYDGTPAGQKDIPGR